MTDWNRRHMDLAQHVAQWSKDPSTKVGAVIVGANQKQIALGYNGFPPRIADTAERLADKVTKYALTQHAERNALDNAAFDTRGATLVSTFHPCLECVKSMISKGIVHVICPPVPDREPWATSGRQARALMDEAMVTVTYLT